MDVGQRISDLIVYAMDNGLISKQERVWAYNTILDAVGATGPAPDFPDHLDMAFDLQKTLKALAEAARENGVLEPEGDDNIFTTRVMGLLMPRPAEVARRFEERYAQSPRTATDWFYRLCGAADYIKHAAIARDVKWTTDTSWGTLEITVNLSKPEKDPRSIAFAALRAPSDDAYPACQLCWSNEGYPGRTASPSVGSHPARQNLRVVPITLGGQNWGLQYSPYAYFTEHCIALNERHVPIRIDRGCFTRLFDFVDLFPHYFIGSNADLPIVGGSILAHDHFQGGRHIFPMELAPVDAPFSLPASPDIEAGVLRWPTTVIRLSGTDRERLIDAAVGILESWREYTDETVGVIAESADGRHNTITPILYRHDDKYVLDLALRCNVTSDEHPLGVFHPHEELHHIKKENIGLIEVMGMAVLPPRLDRELRAVAHGLIVKADRETYEADPLTASHACWACEVTRRHPELDAGNVEAILHDEVGFVFAQVLEQTGVFKWDDEGRLALGRFIDRL